MTKINLQQKNYAAEQRTYQLVLPINYEVIIPEDDSVRLLSQITEELNYTELYRAYSSDGRNPAAEPKILFKAVAYTCHNGKQLKPVSAFKRKSATGYTSDVTVYECESCEGCPHKDKCTKAKGNRRMEVSKVFVEKRRRSYENITSELGTQLRVNRSIQSEGAFGVLKEDRQFDRFLTRGKQKVKTEILLLCFGYNVNKLHAKIQSERCGKDLHELNASA